MAFDHLIAEFGRSVGMEGLQPNANGVVCLSVGHTGDLYLERTEGEDAVVYLMRDQAYPRENLYREALRLCHPAERLPFLAHVGWRGENRLGFFIRLGKEDQILPQLETAIDQLRRMHDRMEQVAS